MMRSEYVITILLIINAIVAVIYLILGFLRHKDIKKTVIYFVLMIMIPIFFILYLLTTRLLSLITRLLHPDLSDVVFDKDRISALDRGDALAENNLVPIEEALAVSDRQSLRTFMLNVLKGDVSDSLDKLQQALVSDDSETAHYAATVLREELNRFRSNVFRSVSAIKNSEGSERDETCIVMIRYMNEYMKRDLFPYDEEREYAMQLADAGDIVFEDDPDSLTVDDMYGICNRLLECRIYDRSKDWCVRLADKYPDKKESYLAIITYCFATGRYSGVEEGLNALMASGIPVDEETMQHIRTFR